ncbi:GH14144 [Drosophila grimshawi]|uniref:GH14144 n=1 Tax=Drosophila grimshawi TaxID=7222 RepID=B4JXV4_DROGR|nr:GH14144 [Drosophila grimshawi]
MLRQKRSSSSRSTLPGITVTLTSNGPNAHLSTACFQRLELNRKHLRQRITFSLELYHKNIIKKHSNNKSNKISVYKLAKYVGQT